MCPPLFQIRLLPFQFFQPQQDRRIGSPRVATTTQRELHRLLQTRREVGRHRRTVSRRAATEAGGHAGSSSRTVLVRGKGGDEQTLLTARGALRSVRQLLRPTGAAGRVSKDAPIGRLCHEAARGRAHVHCKARRGGRRGGRWLLRGRFRRGGREGVAAGVVHGGYRRYVVRTTRDRGGGEVGPAVAFDYVHFVYVRSHYVHFVYVGRSCSRCLPPVTVPLHPSVHGDKEYGWNTQ